MNASVHFSELNQKRDDLPNVFERENKDDLLSQTSFKKGN